jgi:predicted porin
MKKLVILLAALGGTMTNGAFAQSSVTMYGVVSTSIRHATNELNADGTRGSLTSLDQGIFQGPRLGFKGVEDFGNGNAAVFQLEMGMSPDTGDSDQQGQLFGRQAFVGLKNKEWGEIDLGRQYGVAFDMLGNYDPVGAGNTSENSWQLLITGIRFDNTLKYTNTWGPVSAEVQYSFGEQAGSTSIGSTTGLGLKYDNGVFSVGAFDQLSRDADSNKANIAGVGARLQLDPVTFYLNYINARRDAGFNKAASGSGGPLANTSMMGNANNTLLRTDNVITAGLLYQATPKMGYIFGYMTDFVKNETSAGNSGRLSTLYAIADYNLSKRTDVYVNLDYSRVSGGEIDDGALTNTVLQAGGVGLGGATNRTGISVGLRTKF